MKKLLRELAFQLRSALPFAIVDNGTWADGTHRPQSYLSKLISYQNVQDAIDAGNTHIKIKPGLYPGFVVNVNNVKIEGSGFQSLSYGNEGTIIDGYLGETGYTNAILIDPGNGVHISHLQARTTAGNGANFAAIKITNSNNVTLHNIHIYESDDAAISVLENNAHTKIINCEISGSIDSDQVQFIANTTNTNNNCGLFESKIQGSTSTGVYLAPIGGSVAGNGNGGCFISDNYFACAGSHCIWSRGISRYCVISGNCFVDSLTNAFTSNFESVASSVFVGNAWTVAGGFTGNSTNCIFSLNS